MKPLRKLSPSSLRILCALCVSALCLFFSLRSSLRANPSQESSGVFRGQSQEEADSKSTGCISCHTSTDEPTMHPTKTVHLGCTDCHGGNPSIAIPPGAAPNSSEYKSAKKKAHVLPHDHIFKDRSALPERTFTKWLKESYEYVKFVNPGDLRVDLRPLQQNVQASSNLQDFDCSKACSDKSHPGVYPIANIAGIALRGE